STGIEFPARGRYWRDPRNTSSAIRGTVPSSRAWTTCCARSRNDVSVALRLVVCEGDPAVRDEPDLEHQVLAVQLARSERDVALLEASHAARLPQLAHLRLHQERLGPIRFLHDRERVLREVGGFAAERDDDVRSHALLDELPAREVDRLQREV